MKENIFVFLAAISILLYFAGMAVLIYVSTVMPGFYAYVFAVALFIWISAPLHYFFNDNEF